MQFQLLSSQEWYWYVSGIWKTWPHKETVPLYDYQKTKRNALLEEQQLRELLVIYHNKNKGNYNTGNSLKFNKSLHIWWVKDEKEKGVIGLLGISHFHLVKTEMEIVDVKSSK